MRILCVVPARGGSKGVPRKNLRAVGGKPLLVWLAELERTDPGRYRLLLAGEGRFAPPEESAPIRKALAPVQHLVERPGWISRNDFS